MTRQQLNFAMLAILEVLDVEPFAPEGVVAMGLMDRLGCTGDEATGIFEVGALGGIWERLHHTLRITESGRDVLRRAREYAKAVS